MKKKIKILLCGISVIFVFGYAGRLDWSEQVIYNMPESAYITICEKLGTNDSFDIAKEYTRNKAYYDALSR